MKQLLIMMVALTLGATSCQKANVEPLPNGQGDGTKSGKQVEVTLNLTVAPPESSLTKGTGSQTFTSDALDVTYSAAADEPGTTKSTNERTPDEESRVNNVWILQFNKSDGKANGTPVYLSGINAIGIQSGNEVGIPAKLTEATTAQVIYVVANTGSSSIFSGANAPADEAALNAKAYSVGAEFKPSAGYMLMLSRIEVPAVNTAILGGTLERMVAKVKLNLKNEFPDFEVGYVQLKNVAANFYYRPAQTGSVNFPAVADGSHIDYPSEPFDKETYVYYIPENLRTTTGTVNSVGERTLDKTDGKATYIEIKGFHRTGNTATPVTYRLPLGDVATSIGDLNVRRNRVYTMDVTLKGANTVDQRITVAVSGSVTPPTPTTTSAPANSFMVTPGAKVSFDARIAGNGGDVAGTGLATAIAPASMGLLWQDTEGLVSPYGVAMISLTGGIATVQTTAGKAGNALVAAYDGPNGTGEILWSWHIWVTDYAPAGQASVVANTAYTVTGGQVHTYGTRYLAANPGKVIMDRNLGATKAFYNQYVYTSDAIQAYGQYYQWGRKDPMGQWDGAITNTNSANGAVAAFAPWYNAVGATVTSANIRGPVTLAVAYQNPTKFYTNSGDWLSTRNDNLWGNGGAKTIFDPCPAGWRVPKNGTWNDFTSTGGNVTSGDELYTGTIFPWFTNGVQQTANGTPTYAENVRNGRLYQQGSVKAWYPVGGDRNTSGNLAYVGNYGCYLTSGASGTNSYISIFNYSSITPSRSDYRVYGNSVRCIQE